MLPALKAFADNPVWTSNPIHAPYAKASATLRPNGYAGPLGYASAGVMADYVLVDMFAQAVTGQASTEDAIAGPTSAPTATTPEPTTAPAGPSAWAPCPGDPHCPARPADRSLFSRITESRNGLGFLFMLPAAAFLICFLTYPLGLGVWLGFTDTKIGRAGVFIGLENYRWLWDDAVFWLSVFNTVFYTFVASILKFALGLWLALILNEKLPFKSFFRADRAAALGGADRALGAGLLVDLRRQFSIISWSLMKWG